MAVQYFDIDDQYNKANIEAAMKMREEDKKLYKGQPCPFKSWPIIPEEDEEAIEIKR